MKSCEQEVMRNSSATEKKIPDYEHIVVNNKIKRLFSPSTKNKESILLIRKKTNFFQAAFFYFQGKVNRPFPEDEILANRQKLIKQLEEERHTRNYNNATYF